MTATEPEHSPLGGSSAERWMNCPGSSVILSKLQFPETDEPDYRRDGIAAHEAAAHCLTEGLDAWEIIGEIFYEVQADAPMAEAIQVYLDYIRSITVEGSSIRIEAPIGEKSRPHPKFYGRIDWEQYGPEILDVVDYKHGEGIVVEPDENAQMMYYAYGIIWERTSRGVEVRSDRLVRLHIVQPRAYHEDGPIRVWDTTVGEIVHWGENVLIPAMKRAEFDVTLDPGKWCRFCPAKLFCPLLEGLFGAAAKADASLLPSFGQKRMALEYAQLEAVNFYVKALKDEVYRRNMLGNTVPGTKLVLKRANRIWNEQAEIALAALGDSRFTKPELKSPAEIEKLGPAAKKLVAEFAYLPNNGLTVALDTAKAPAVKVEKAEDTFAHLINAGDQNV